MSSGVTAGRWSGLEASYTIAAGHEAPDPTSVPPSIGRYRVQAKLGEGGMGVVYVARDEQLGRRVALKLVRAARRDAVHAARILREARALARLSDPHVVEIYDVATHGDDLVIAMEFVEADTLRDWLAIGRGLPTIGRALADVGRGLMAVHRAGLVHRDVKPDNVLVGADGRVRLADFGLARLTTEAMAPAPVTDDGWVDPEAVTTEGVVIGTPAYMAPEQHIGRPADARADQFALCVMAWEAIYGQRPYRGRSLQEIARAKLTLPVPPRRDDVPRAWTQALLRGLAPHPDARHPSVAPLVAAFAAPPSRRRRSTLWLGLGAVVATTTAVAVVARREPSCEALGRAGLAAYDDDARARIDATFSADTAPVVAQLDEYAAGWRTQWDDACRGLPKGALRDRTLACLGERERQLEATVRMLAGRDRLDDLAALEAVAGLPPVDACGTEEGASEDPDAELPEQQGARVAALRRDLAQAQVFHRAGLSRESLSSAIAIEARAEALGYEPVRLEAQLLVGWSYTDLGENVRAYEVLEPAFHDAVAAGQDRAAVGAANSLSRICSFRHDCTEDGEAWLTHGRTAAERVGDPKLRLELAVTESTVRLQQGRNDDAAVVAREGLALSESLGHPRPRTRARLLRGLGDALYDEGRHTEAREVYLQARALFVALGLLGRQSRLAVDLNLAVIRGWDGDPQGAYADLATIRGEYALALGDRHLDTGRAWLAMGVMRSNYDAAGSVPDIREAIARIEPSLGSDASVTVNAYINLGSSLASSGDVEAAARVFREVVRRLERSLRPDHPDLAFAYNNLALAELVLGNEPEALRLYERAAEIFADGAGDPNIRAHVLLGLAGTLARTHGDEDRIRRLVDAAWREIDGLPALMAEQARDYPRQMHPELEPYLPAAAAP